MWPQSGKRTRYARAVAMRPIDLGYPMFYWTQCRLHWIPITRQVDSELLDAICVSRAGNSYKAILAYPGLGVSSAQKLSESLGPMQRFCA